MENFKKPQKTISDHPCPAPQFEKCLKKRFAIPVKFCDEKVFRMEKKLVGLRLLTLAIVFACQAALWAAPSIEVAHVHFLGGDQMIADPSMPIFKKVSAITNTPAFRTGVARGVAKYLAGTLGRQLNPAAAGSGPLLTPLVDDVIGSESISTFGGTTNQPLGFVFAIRLDDAHAKAWQETLTRILGTAPEVATIESFPGQSWKKAAFKIVRAKEWLVLSRGADLTPVLTQYLQTIKQQGRPGKALQGLWLSADADWTRMGSWVALEDCPFKPAAMEVTIGPKNEYQKSILKLHYPQPIKWKSQPWRVPAESIRDPLDSFTAMQGVSEFLQPSRELAQLKVNPLNQQAFVWAMQEVPFRTYGAMLTENSDATYRDLAKQLPALFNPKLHSLYRGEFIELTNRTQIGWQGLPFVVPLISSKKEKAGEYITVSFFPPPKQSAPAPTELLSQVTGNNLVYYDWELTGSRLQQWRTMCGILPIGIIFVHRRAPSATAPNMPRPGAPQTKPTPQTKPATATHTPAQTPAIPTVNSRKIREQWLTNLEQLLGNSITRATVTGPNEVTVERSSYIGFTGLEILMFSHWFYDDSDSSATPRTPQPPM
jgi:hypothetical protein